GTATGGGSPGPPRPRPPHHPAWLAPQVQKLGNIEGPGGRRHWMPWPSLAWQPSVRVRPGDDRPPEGRGIAPLSPAAGGGVKELPNVPSSASLPIPFG